MGKSIIFDPFITPNELATKIDAGSLMPEYMLLSHGHSDHVADAIAIAKQSNCKVVSNWEMVVWAEKNGVSNTHPMNTGGKWSFDFGTVKLLNAVHSSSLPDGSYGGNPVGFLLNSENKNIYYSGDTALHSDMALIPRFGKLDAAFLCMGDNFTMGVDDALMAAQMIECDEIIGMHYNTFGYIKIDEDKAVEKFRAAGKKLRLMKIGETINF